MKPLLAVDYQFFKNIFDNNDPEKVANLKYMFHITLYELVEKAKWAITTIDGVIEIANMAIVNNQTSAAIPYYNSNDNKIHVRYCDLVV